MPKGIRHWTPRPVVHRLPLEKSLSEIPRLNPSLDWWKQNTNLTETHKRASYLELWLEETRRAPFWLKAFSTFYCDLRVFSNVLRNHAGAGRMIKQKGQPLPHKLLQSSYVLYQERMKSDVFLQAAIYNSSSHILFVV